MLAHTTYTNPVRTTAKHRLYSALQKPVLEPLLHLAIWLSPVLWLLNVLSYLNGSAHHSTARHSFAGTQTRQQVQFVTRCLLHTSPAVLARGMLGMLRYDATSTLATLDVPVLLGSCPRINTHPSVGVGLSAWMSPLALFCWLGYHLNTARGDVPDALPTLKGPIERHVGGSDELKPSSRHVHSATA